MEAAPSTISTATPGCVYHAFGPAGRPAAFRRTCQRFVEKVPTDTVQNPDFPFVGTLEERAHATQTLNRLLEECAAEHGLKYFKYDHLYATDAYVLDRAKSDGTVHIALRTNAELRRRLASL